LIAFRTSLAVFMVCLSSRLNFARLNFAYPARRRSGG
jgi:hypothetical protein